MGTQAVKYFCVDIVSMASCYPSHMLHHINKTVLISS